jgi:RNA polymerase sigma factor (sigma-70 family)
MLDEGPKQADAEVSSWIENYLKTGDKQYWGRIFEKYKKQIFVRCLRILNNSEDARDLTSEAFIKAFENIQNFDLKRSFFPWLYQLTTNLCIDHIRRKKLIQFNQIEDQVISENPEDVIVNLERKELGNHIKQAIRKLKRPQKRCFCLFYIQQKSYKEIAELTGYSFNEVRSYIQNGRRKFKSIMEKNLSTG